MSQAENFHLGSRVISLPFQKIIIAFFTPQSGLIHVKPEVTVNATLFPPKILGGAQHRCYYICAQGGPEHQESLGLAK